MAALLSGCATNFDQASIPPATTLGNMQGRIIGGQQPVVGAAVYVYAATTAGYNMPSASLLTAYSTGSFPTTEDANGNYYVTTASDGSFQLTGEYTCTAGQQVYLYAIGGNPGAGVNSASGFLAILGRCPNSGTLSASVPYVVVNELTTVAAAYALAGFALDATDISSSASPLATEGLGNAFSNAANLVSIQSNVSALIVTPSGTGTPPTAEINTLADVLTSCINSSGPSSPACNLLFANATSTGAPSGNQPTDTATAAINIAHHPASNVAALFNLAGSSPPFVPVLTSQPKDFSVSISFTGGGIGSSNGHSPHSVAIDGLGAVYATSSSNSTLTKMSPLGVFTNANGITGNGLSGPTSVAVSITSTLIYVANSTGTGFSRFSVAGTSLGKTALGDAIQDVEIDGSGNIWATGYTGPELYNDTATGGTITSFTGNGLSKPFSLALSSGTAGNVWVANSGAANLSAFSNSGTALTNSPFTDSNSAVGVAIDVVGLIWVSNSDGTVALYSASGTAFPGSPYSVASTSLSGIAIDGNDRIWATSPGDGALYELGTVSRSGVAATAFVPIPAAAPDGLAIDCSGNVWYNTTTDSTLREIVGLATPVITPIAFGVASSLLATRP